MTEKLTTLVETFQVNPLSSTVWELVGSPRPSDRGFALSPGQGLESVKWYDLIYSDIFMAVEVDDQTNFLMSCQDSNGGAIEIELAIDVLYFRLISEGTTTEVNVDYDPERQLYWRIRERDFIAYWETSPDGSLWNVERQDVHGIDASNVKFVLMNKGL